MAADLVSDRRLFGLIGEVVDGNPTEEMMEEAFASAGLPWKYVSMAITQDRFGDAMAGVRTLGFAGLHVTKPYKIRAVDAVDELSPGAAAIGAVNCVVRRDGRLVGDNTDGRGLVDAVARRLDLTNRSAVVLGAGGAARAIAVEVARAGAREITIVSRSSDAGGSLADAVRSAAPTRCVHEIWRGIHEVPPWTDLVVNATSVGMIDPDEPVDVDLGRLGPGAVIADVVIAPRATAVIEAAAARGFATVSGAEMLIEQAAISFAIWTSREPDRDVLTRALTRALRAVEQ